MICWRADAEHVVETGLPHHFADGALADLAQAWLPRPAPGTAPSPDRRSGTGWPARISTRFTSAVSTRDLYSTLFTCETLTLVTVSMGQGKAQPQPSLRTSAEAAEALDHALVRGVDLEHARWQATAAPARRPACSRTPPGSRSPVRRCPRQPARRMAAAQSGLAAAAATPYRASSRSPPDFAGRTLLAPGCFTPVSRLVPGHLGSDFRALSVRLPPSGLDGGAFCRRILGYRCQQEQVWRPEGAPGPPVLGSGRSSCQIEALRAGLRSPSTTPAAYSRARAAPAVSGSVRRMRCTPRDSRSATARPSRSSPCPVAALIHTASHGAVFAAIDARLDLQGGRSC